MPLTLDGRADIQSWNPSGSPGYLLYIDDESEAGAQIIRDWREQSG